MELFKRESSSVHCAQKQYMDEEEFVDEFYCPSKKAPNVNPIGSSLITVEMYSNTSQVADGKDGLIVWLPGLTMDACKRFIEYEPSDAPPLTATPPYGFTFTMASSAFVITSINVNVSPGVDELANSNFVYSRVNAGHLRVNSATSGGITTPGVISCGAIQDIRAMFPFGTPATIGQQCVTSKDAVLGEPAAKGVEMIVGDFAPVSYSIPLLQNNQVSAFSGMETSILFSPATYSSSTSRNNYVWISSIVSVSSTDVANRLTPTPISPFTVPYLKLRCKVDAGSITGTPAIHVHHYFGAAVETSGSSTLTMDTAVYSDMFPLLQGEAETGPAPIPAEGDQVFYSKGKSSTNRMWLGTMVVIASNAANNGLVHIQSIEFGDPDRFKEGHLGPARVAIYSGFNQGQEVTISGKSGYECAVAGSIAPYRKASDAYMRVSLEDKIERSRLFNTDCECVKRSWPAEQLDGLRKRRRF